MMMSRLVGLVGRHLLSCVHAGAHPHPEIPTSTPTFLASLPPRRRRSPLPPLLRPPPPMKNFSRCCWECSDWIAEVSMRAPTPTGQSPASCHSSIAHPSSFTPPPHLDEEEGARSGQGDQHAQQPVGGRLLHKHGSKRRVLAAAGCCCCCSRPLARCSSGWVPYYCFTTPPASSGLAPCRQHGRFLMML